MDDALFPQYSAEGRELIRKAYDVAEKALAGEIRSNGTPFFGHPLAVAKIVANEIGLPPECVAAVFLHEATRGGKVDLDIHALKLDESVYTMVDGLNKISTIKPKDTRLEAENYKKLIIQYSTDPRVTVLKLADRLEVMRSLAIFPKADRERKVLETLMLYIPLAHQLGLYNMKREMEDIYLSYAEPEQYRLITNKLKATQKDREKLMAEFIEPLKVKLSEAGIQYKLKIRTKAAYSIWAKMVKQKVPFEGVFDVFAIRFIIDCPEDIKLERELCWKVFGFVTEEYEQDTKRLRDWVTNPKPNGYESLHITVKNRDGAYVEVQIRTRRMDEMMTDLKEYRLTKEFMTRLLDMGEMVSVTAFCALGKGCYSTLQSAYHYFPEEFAAHLDGHCSLCENERRDPILPGSIPFDRKRIVIDPDTCRGCSRCARSCHAEAISGVIKSPFVIDPDKCVKCYNCMDLCAFGAIREVEIDA